jgi:hypothetical protein
MPSFIVRSCVAYIRLSEAASHKFVHAAVGLWISTAFELQLIPETFYVIEICGEHSRFRSLRCCKSLHVHYESAALGKKQMRLRV